MNTQALRFPWFGRTPAALRAREDEAIRRRVLRRLEREPWWDSSIANVFVDAGVVIYQGCRNALADRPTACRVALTVPGVRAVWDARVWPTE